MIVCNKIKIFYINLNLVSLVGTCVPLLLTNVVGNVGFIYWKAVTVILKFVLPMPIGAICVLMVVWRMATAQPARVALIHTSTSNNTSNTMSGGGQKYSPLEGPEECQVTRKP